jgi:DNA-binding response OmpR family regulator
MTALAADATEREGETLTVLLIEDHADTREMLGKVLTKLGHRALIATCCADARAVAVDPKTVDLILGDVGLPDGDGVALLQELKQRFGCRVAALTGYGQQVDVDRTTAAGVDWHLTKPVEILDLRAVLARVRTSLPRPNARA